MSLLAFTNLGAEEAPKPHSGGLIGECADGIKALTTSYCNLADAIGGMESLPTIKAVVTGKPASDKILSIGHCGSICGFLKLPNNVRVFYHLSDEDIHGYHGSHGDVGIIRRASETVGVYQYIDGTWVILYNSDEAEKKFSKLGGKKTGFCSTCGEKENLGDLIVKDDEYYCMDCHRELFKTPKKKKVKDDKPVKCDECGTWTPSSRLKEDGDAYLVCCNCAPELFEDEE